MAKKNLLKDMEISSVDLCKRGANQKADIKLFKSADAEKGGEREHMETNTMIEKIARFLAGVVSGEPGTITKADSTAQVYETTEALRKSLESIIADDSLTPVEKQDMMAESLQQFTLEATDCMESWSTAIGKAEDEEDEDAFYEGDFDDEEEEEDDEPGHEPEKKTVEKGVFDMDTIDITKMSPEDQAALNALIAKYNPEHETNPAPAQEMHPDVKKALDEVAELRKSMAIQEMTGIAKKYEIIGKNAEELGTKLYELKKAGEQHYNDYVALLDEQVKMQESTGLFKEYGTSRSGTPTDLDGMVAELRKADPNLTREDAICKAFEMNPNLDPFTGKSK